MMNRSFAVGFACCWLMLLVACGPAWAATKIESLPYRISAPGRYELAGNLAFPAATGAAIAIEASDVTLDLAGHTISGAAGDATAAVGILAVDRRNITLTSGRISGFYFGVDIRSTSRTEPASSGHRLQHLVLEKNRYFGVRVEGTRSEIADCRIANTGGSTRAGHTIPHAVRMVGANNTLRDSCVENMILTRFPNANGEIVAVHFDAAPGSVLQNNTLIEVVGGADAAIPADDNRERRFGVWVNGGPRRDTFLTATGNRFEGWQVPFAFTPGTDGRVRDNTFAGAAGNPIRGRPSGELIHNRQVEAAGVAASGCRADSP